MAKRSNARLEHSSGASRSGRKRPDQAAEANRKFPGLIPVVGIGASAGGIEALGSFFDAMPADSGCAFVGGMALAPDHIYVIAPATDPRVVEDGLKVSKPSKPRGQRHPVDVLLASIAAEGRGRLIAIVLSGTGSKRHGGIEGNEEDGNIVADEVPVAFLGIEFHREAAHVAGRIHRACAEAPTSVSTLARE